MKLDTDKNGLLAVFKSWQVPLVHELLKGEPMNSRAAYEFLEEHGVKATQQRGLGSVSRASVINFLNSLVDQELLEFTLETGKGGHRRIYKMILTREEVAHLIIRRFADKLKEAFPDHSGVIL